LKVDSDNISRRGAGLIGGYWCENPPLRLIS
jgi:hypothetical protein